MELKEAKELGMTEEEIEAMAELEMKISSDLDNELKQYQKTREKRANFDMNRVCYPTGFTTVDFFLGRNNPSRVKEGEVIKNRGLRDGVLFTIGGTTHKGKSVFAMNVAGNIVRPFIQKGLPAWIEYFTPEEGLESDWMQVCCGLGNDAIRDNLIRITHRHKVNTSIEGLFKLVMDLYKLKTESPDKFMYDTINMDGEPTKKFVPTVLVVDSWTQLRSKALDIKDEASNTFHARRNNINGMFLEQMRPFMLEANIMLFAIVHVGEKIGIDSMYLQKSYSVLNAKVNISGGKQLEFETEFGVVLDKYRYDSSEKLEKDLGLKIENAKVVECAVYKSRFAMHDSTTKFCLLSDPNYGFNPLMSLMIDMLDMHPVLEDAGSYKYLKGDKDNKFYRKDFIPKFLEDEAFRMKAMEVYAKNFDKYTRHVDNLAEVTKMRNMLDIVF